MTDEISEQLKKLTLQGVKNLNQQLGKGAYGRVFTVKYNGVICAAKEIHSILVEASDRYQANFMLECIRCSELTHPNSDLGEVTGSIDQSLCHIGTHSIACQPLDYYLP